MKSIIECDFHNKDDEDNKFKRGDLKVRKVVKIRNIDKNFVLVGTFNSKNYGTKTIKVKSKNYIFKKGEKNLEHNIFVENIMVVHKARLRNVIGELDEDSALELKKKSENYLKNNVERNKFIKLIETKKIYKLDQRKQIFWEKENQFSDENKKHMFNRERMLLRIDYLNERNEVLCSDIKESLKSSEFFKNKLINSFEKLVTLNQKENNENEYNHLKKLYYDINQEFEKNKIELNIYKKFKQNSEIELKKLKDNNQDLVRENNDLKNLFKNKKIENDVEF